MKTADGCGIEEEMMKDLRTKITITLDPMEGFEMETDGNAGEFLSMMTLATGIQLNRQRKPGESDELLAEQAKICILTALKAANREEA